MVLAVLIVEQYQTKSVGDMQNALKDIFGPMFEAMLNNNQPVHKSNDKGEKECSLSNCLEKLLVL